MDFRKFFIESDTGESIAKELNLKYIGMSKDMPGVFWFVDNKTESSLVAKDLDEARDKQQKMWKKFKVK